MPPHDTPDMSDLELSVFLASAKLETLEMRRDQAEFELHDVLAEAIGNGLRLDAAARAANLTQIEILASLGLRPTTFNESP